jgi:hypothetical protein
MWQSTHALPGRPGSCIRWRGTSKTVALWHRSHRALPDARSAPRCGSWQSVHTTPAAFILLCAKEPYSNTSSLICPSGKYEDASSSSTR